MKRQIREATRGNSRTNGSFLIKKVGNQGKLIGQHWEEFKITVLKLSGEQEASLLFPSYFISVFSDSHNSDYNWISGKLPLSYSIKPDQLPEFSM